MEAATQSRRFIRLPEVEHRTGFKRAHIYQLMADKKFPATIRIGSRAVAWDSGDIDQWMDERVAAAGV